MFVFKRNPSAVCIYLHSHIHTHTQTLHPTKSVCVCFVVVFFSSVVIIRTYACVSFASKIVSAQETHYKHTCKCTTFSLSLGKILENSNSLTKNGRVFVFFSSLIICGLKTIKMIKLPRVTCKVKCKSVMEKDRIKNSTSTVDQYRINLFSS